MNQKGSASIEIVLLATVLIIFIMMPLISLAIERVIISHSINVVVDTMEAAAFSVASSMDMKDLAEGRISYDVTQVEEKFKVLIKDRLKDFVEVDIAELTYHRLSSGTLPCRPGRRLKFDTLHVKVAIGYEHKLYRKVISDELKRRVQFHFDLELPQNR